MIAFLLAAATSACPDPSLKEVKDFGAMIHSLSRRSIAILSGDPSARQFVSVDAEFSLVVGDAGSSLGKGPIGAATLSKQLNAVTYEYAPWISVPAPADPCAKQEVQVRFYDKSGESGAVVKFQYDKGRLIRADGWTVARVVGSFPASVH